MTGPTAILLALALAAEGQLDAGLRVGASAHRTTPATPANERSVDLLAAPTVGLALRGGALSASGRYAPTFTAVDLGPDEHGAVMHNGQLRLGLEPDPAFRLELTGNGSTGQTDLVTLNTAGTSGGSGGPVTNTITTTRYVRIERYSAGASLRLAPDRRGVFELYGGVLQDGGTDAFSRQSYPIVRGLEANGSAGWSASRLDLVGLRAAGYLGRIADRHVDSSWVSAMVTWRRRLSRQAEAWTGAGGVVLWSRDRASPGDARRRSDREVKPAGELGVARTALDPADVTGQLVSRLGASADRVTGITSPSADLSGDLRWPLDRTVALTAHAVGSLSWPSAGHRSGRRWAR